MGTGVSNEVARRSAAQVGARPGGNATPAASGAVFLRGVLVGAGLSTVAMFIALGLWFRSAEAEGFRHMLGEQTKVAIDTQLGARPAPDQGAPTTVAPSPPAAAIQADIRAAIQGPAQPAPPTGALPPSSARWPAALRGVEQAYERIVASPPAAPLAPEQAVNAPTAPALASPKGQSLALPELSPPSPVAVSAPLDEPIADENTAMTRQAARELGIEDLVKKQEHNRQVVGRAGALLRSLTGQ